MKMIPFLPVPSAHATVVVEKVATNRNAVMLEKQAHRVWVTWEKGESSYSRTKDDAVHRECIMPGHVDGTQDTHWPHAPFPPWGSPFALHLLFFITFAVPNIFRDEWLGAHFSDILGGGGEACFRCVGPSASALYY